MGIAIGRRRMRNMELTQLYYFYVAAKYEHMTKASEELHIAQPALTQSVKHLEKEFGVPLFVHKGRNVVLSPHGKLLQKRVETIMQTLRKLPEEMKELSGLQERTIRINVMAASAIMTDIIINYKRLHPEVNFILTQDRENEECDLSVSTATEIEEAALQGKYDIAFSEEIFLAVPEKSQYYIRNSVFLEEVAGENFISLAGSRPLRAICDRFCMEAGFFPKVIFESDSPTTVRKLIAAGLGVAFWPAYSWGKIPMEHVALVPIVSPVCKRDLVVTCHEDIMDVSIRADFYRYVVKNLQALGRNGEKEDRTESDGTAQTETIEAIDSRRQRR